MKSQLVKILRIVVPLGLGIFVLWYFYSSMPEEDKNQMVSSIKNANYFWVFVSLLMGFLSHLSRGIRWNLLLEPMGYKPKITNSYHCVMIGYLVNLALPRAGEFSRAIYLQQAEKVPFEKGFGTVVAERLIDALMLLTIFGLAIISMGEEGSDAFSKITENNQKGGFPLWGYALIGIAVLGILFFVFKDKLITKLKSMIGGFIEGLKTVYKMKRRIEFILHTLLIWIMYVGMFWVCFHAINYTNYNIGMMLAAFVAGAFAMMASQGGIGFYQLWVTAVLYKIFTVPEGDAGALASVIWVSQTLLVIALGLISFLTINKSIKQNAAELSE